VKPALATAFVHHGRCGLCLVLLHRGRIRWAGFIFTAVIWLVMTLAFYFSGGIRAPQFSGYLVVALMAGLLINGRMGIAYALAGSAAGLVFVWLAANGRLPEPRMTHTPFSLWSVYTIYFLVQPPSCSIWLLKPLARP
jgi:hypothetical protein